MMEGVGTSSDDVVVGVVLVGISLVAAWFVAKLLFSQDSSPSLNTANAIAASDSDSSSCVSQPVVTLSDLHQESESSARSSLEAARADVVLNDRRDRTETDQVSAGTLIPAQKSKEGAVQTHQAARTTARAGATARASQESDAGWFDDKASPDDGNDDSIDHSIGNTSAADASTSVAVEEREDAVVGNNILLSEEEIARRRAESLLRLQDSFSAKAARVAKIQRKRAAEELKREMEFSGKYANVGHNTNTSGLGQRLGSIPDSERELRYQEEREARAALVAQQDAEFEESSLKDRILAHSRRLRLQDLNMRARLRAALPGEPIGTGKAVFSVAVRLPTGERLSRAFDPSSGTLKHVIDFARGNYRPPDETFDRLAAAAASSQVSASLSLGECAGVMMHTSLEPVLSMHYPQRVLWNGVDNVASPGDLATPLCDFFPNDHAIAIFLEHAQ